MNRRWPEAVIFDLDGTLVDSMEDIGAAVNAVLAASGFPVHPVADYQAMLGWGLRQLVTLALPEDRRDPGTLATLTTAVLAEYARQPLVHTRPYPGIPALLKELGGRGVALAVLSNKPDALTQVIVAGLFAEAGFSFVQGERAGAPRKPDPAVALAFCGGRGISPSAVLFVGDSEVDVETAHAAGMVCAGALWGYRSRADLSHAGADFLVAHPDELLTLAPDGSAGRSAGRQ